MFKKLRNRFLMLNLVIISVMMLISFATIYVVTDRNIKSEINADLRRLSGIGGVTGKAPGLLRDIGKILVPSGQPKTLQEIALDMLPKNRPTMDERTISFIVATDMNWNIKSTFSLFKADRSFFENAVRLVLQNGPDKGMFKLDGDHWAYMARPVSGGYMVAFLNTSPQVEFLNSLIYTFVIVALVMLVIIYLASRFFANKAIMPVKEAFEKQRQFIADASHELRTPLAVINTNVDVLLANGRETIERQSKWLHYIKSETERMSKLANDLLYLAQVDSSGDKMVFAGFGLSEAVENVVLAMEAVVFENRRTLQYQIEPGLSAYGNAEGIKEVVMILLDNAVKYSDQGGRISVSLRKKHNDAVLAVSNTGEGIPEEHLDKIFDRFYRVDKSRSRKAGGHGLGLAIARAVVERHKGKIYARSIPGEKTTFFVELPLASRQWSQPAPGSCSGPGLS